MCFEKNRKSWSSEEQALLKEMYGNFGPKSWKKIAKEFKKQGYRRNEIEIREKWVNHVDPGISNSDWTFEELQTLYKSFDLIGSKWSCIKKQISGRTQVKIKNKFYSNLRVYIRFVLVYYEGKNCSNKRLINRIPPNVLNQIYNGQNRFEFIGREFKDLLQRMRFQIDKKILEDRLEQNSQLYKKLHEQLNEVFSQITQNHEFKQILQNDESYYSELESGKIRKMETRAKIGSNLVLKQNNENQDIPSPDVKIEEEGENKISQSEPNTVSPGWGPMMGMGQKIGYMEPFFYFNMYGFMPFMKTE